MPLGQNEGLHFVNNMRVIRKRKETEHEASTSARHHLSGAVHALRRHAAMPPLTQASSINNFKYSHTNSSGNWVFTWDTINGEVFYKFQFKGGGWQKVYVSVQLKSFSSGSSGGTSSAVISPIYSVSGSSLQFRLKLGVVQINNTTPWATTSHTFS